MSEASDKDVAECEALETMILLTVTGTKMNPAHALAAICVAAAELALSLTQDDAALKKFTAQDGPIVSAIEMA